MPATGAADVERVELEQPRQAVEGAGAQVELLSIHDGEIAARNNDLEDAGTFTVDRLVGDASVDDYDALLLPGGTVNPDKLRMDERAVGFVRGAGGGDGDGSGERIVVLANLSAATLPIATPLPRATPLYAEGWDAAAATLAPHGWLIATCAR